jgi:hypothetical protein
MANKELERCPKCSYPLIKFWIGQYEGGMTCTNAKFCFNCDEKLIREIIRYIDDKSAQNSMQNG